jgi:hypothetical protein
MLSITLVSSGIQRENQREPNCEITELTKTDNATLERQVETARLGQAV